MVEMVALVEMVAFVAMVVSEVTGVAWAAG